MAVNERADYLHIYCNSNLFHEDVFPLKYRLIDRIEREIHNAIAGRDLATSLKNGLANRVTASEVLHHEGFSYMNWRDNSGANMFLRWRFLDARNSSMVDLLASDQPLGYDKVLTSDSTRTVNVIVDVRFMQDGFFDRMIDALLNLAWLADASDSQFKLTNAITLRGVSSLD